MKYKTNCSKLEMGLIELYNKSINEMVKYNKNIKHYPVKLQNLNKAIKIISDLYDKGYFNN